MKHILFFSVLIFLLASCREKTAVRVPEKPVPVRVTEAVSDSLSLPVKSAGILFSDEEMKLSFKTGGIVARIRVKEGEAVKKGALLASLNLSEINAQVALATTAWEKARRDFERAKNLYADSVATLEQFQNAQSALDASKSNLEVARFNLAHSTLVAPADGKILKMLVRENEITGQGYPVILFGVTGKNWKVRCSLSDRDFVRISEGDSASVTFDAWPGITFPASVYLTGEMANPLTGTYDAELSVDGKGYKLASGFIAAAEIFPSAREHVIMIPLGSVVEADGDHGFVFAVTDSLTVEKVSVSVVGINGNMVSVKGLPGARTRIVSGGAAYLRGGEKIRIAE